MARADRLHKDDRSLASHGRACVAAGAGERGWSVAATAAAAGVPLYQSAQALEQLSRTEKDRESQRSADRAIKSQLANGQFVDGFGSMGGEEFFSYLNISDSLRRTGGEEWDTVACADHR